MEQKGKKRFILLEKIASFYKDAKTKEKNLYEILHWLGDWGESSVQVQPSGRVISLWMLVPAHSVFFFLYLDQHLWGGECKWSEAHQRTRCNSLSPNS